MSKWLRYLEFFGRNPKRDIDDEITSHIEMRETDLRAQGMSTEAARERAQREFGDVSIVRSATTRVDARMLRRERHAELIATTLRDVRVALRSMRANPGYAIASIVCAAFGIGITAAIVSASYAILVRSLPYRDSDRLVAIYSENAVHGYKEANISWPDFVSWRDDNRAFTGVAIWSWNTKTLTNMAGGNEEAERISGADVSWNLFQLLGVAPMLGRQFLKEEDAPGRNFEVIISHGLWQRRFASDSTIVGKTIQLDGRAWTVVGVMPARFNFPDRGDLWVPFAAESNEARGNRGYAGAIARIAPGVTLAQATDDLHRIDADLAARFPEDNSGWRADVVPIRDDLVGNLRQPLHVLLGAVGLVLLLACINVANLTLARGAARGRDVAIRSAIGASRGRLVRQMMTESLVVAVAGGVLGIGIAALEIQLLKVAFPNGLPFYITLGLDGSALALVAAITVLTGVVFGIVPAVRVSRVNLNSALRDGARGAGPGVDRARLRSTLVIGEVALSAMLMMGALLLVRTYRNLHDTPLGFSTDGMLSARITLPKNAGYPTRADVKRFYDRLLERLRGDPRVASAGAAQGIPLTGWDVQGEALVEGAPLPRPGSELIAHFQNVTSDYFATIGVPLLRGRWLDETDRDSLNPSVLVNAQMVAKAFHGANPIGKRVRIGRDAGDPWGTVVGVIGDFHQYRLPQAAPPAVLWSNASYPARQMTLVLRAKRGDGHDLTPLLRSAVRELDPRVALYEVQTMEEVITRSLWRQRLMGNVLGVFAALSLAMACLGLYGVVSYAVAQRTRELGVRVALGATRSSVMRLVLGHGTRLVAIGIVVGLVAAWFAVGILDTLLYGVPAKDPAAFGIVALTLAGVALVAAAIPSRRATRVDPIIAMRAE